MIKKKNCEFFEELSDLDFRTKFHSNNDSNNKIINFETLLKSR